MTGQGWAGHHRPLSLHAWESWPRPERARKGSMGGLWTRLARPAGCLKSNETSGRGAGVQWPLEWSGHCSPGNGPQRQQAGVWGCSSVLGFSSLDGTVTPGSVTEWG